MPGFLTFPSINVLSIKPMIICELTIPKYTEKFDQKGQSVYLGASPDTSNLNMS